MSRTFDSKPICIARARARISELAEQQEGASPEETLRWAVETFGDRLALSVSFGNPEGIVLLDMMARVAGVERTRVFTLDTGFLFEETVRYRREISDRYGIEVEVFRPRLTVAEQAERYGEELYRRRPDLCCQMRKIEPQSRALRGYDAWITGIRREQTRERAHTPVLSWEERFGVVKIAPLADWNQEQVREYVRERDIPLNPLLERGYASIGCEPCTRPVAAGEDPRAGRWSWTDKNECGLHFANGKVKRAVS